MTKAMPFLQKAILLSYDPRRLRRCSLFAYQKRAAQSSTGSTSREQ